MADEKVQVTYEIDGREATSTLNEISDKANNAKSSVGTLGDKLSKLGVMGLGVSFVTQAFGKLWSAMQACEGAYRVQAEAEARLETAMQNTMNATSDDIRLVKDLTAAQQKLGVVGDEVQLAGAQALANYIGEKESLQALIPVMNDMIVSQDGLNASQATATSTAQMIGKAMNGSTALLERYGFQLTDAQEKVMKFGTEQEKVAVLSEVIGRKVGGMNEAMAQTPAGKMQQYANSMGDVGERLGALYTRIRTALLPAMNGLVTVLNTMLDIAEAIFAFVTENLDVLAALAAGIAAVTLAVNALAIKAAIVTTATKLWTAAQAILNVVLTANPIGLVIAAIAALVAAILWVRKHTTGWGTVWDATVTFMKEVFLAWVDSVKLQFNTIVNGIMIGLDKIRLGWYKFKEAVGLGDSDENRRAIERINADVEARQKAIADGAKSMMDHVNKARRAFDNVSLQWKSGEEATDTNKQIKSNANTFGNPLAGGLGLQTASTAKSGAEAIAGGGTRSTAITINFSKEMVRMEFNGGYTENRESVERTLAESLLRVLSAAKASI